MCGIFAYLNFLTPKKRSEVIDILLRGLQRMEYRGYDSAGIAIDGSNDPATPHSEVALLKKVGKVSVLSEHIKENRELDFDVVYNIHCGIAHTRWATHGSPKDVNSHPQRSNKKNEFLVVHNGIITNYREVKEYLLKKGHEFESETDTEVIAKLIQHIADKYPEFSFRQLVETAIQQLEGAFALAFKSSRFPGQLVATRRGSPLLVGIKSSSRLSTDHFPVFFSKARRFVSSQNAEDSHVETPAGYDSSFSTSTPAPRDSCAETNTTSIRHCEGIMSGELKHGPLAMVDRNLGIVMIICSDNVYKKSLNALQQVMAREGDPIIIADVDVPEKDLAGRSHVLRIPKTVDCVQNILTVIPLQLLSYHIADLNGLNVDRPRNLAKSVTVE
ncbi:Glutamine--fructose-6-phosphate aminotransferase [isomerizing] 1 [Toxocara canis]|uniref:glutamine--fructose-6-phosphate transaminase (isomerizing) n=1 Tax=Toxocara canis TaxID=6265 RepID=A0A0B2VLS6_TOXCA|nr:Glutamine--fructose-6-phosphate aminotransferase [isomerizing] 1 [Toxocara canis]